MLESEKFALAARLHVMLRRKANRLIDVEWMVKNREYAEAILRFARDQQDAELASAADKFEVMLAPAAPRKAAPLLAPRPPEPTPHLEGGKKDDPDERYVFTLR
ncbi:hypothetical protein [Aquabacterium sp.]|uniref:hypothetical protein n=1 Tax=Aquabacterium sp. TaxID=1872578 RepID=UPI0035AF051A